MQKNFEKKCGLFFALLLALTLISSIAYAQFDPLSGVNGMQNGQPQGNSGINGQVQQVQQNQGFMPQQGQQMNQQGINQQNNQNVGFSMGASGVDFGMPSSVADPEYVAQQKFAEAMTTAYTWISTNSTDFIKGCKEDRDGLVQKLNFVIQQAQETSTACKRFETESATCNPETFCANFEKGQLPMPPEAKIAFKLAGYNPNTLTMNSINEDMLMKVCMGSFESEMAKVKQKAEKMKEQIKSQLSNFRTQCTEMKKREEQQMNQGFRLPGFGPMQNGPNGQQMNVGGGQQGPGGCKDIGAPPSQNCHTEPPQGCPERWECGNQTQYNQQPQGGGRQGNPPQCQCGWNCNNGAYNCNTCNQQQQPPQGQAPPQCGADQHLEGNICVSNQQTQQPQQPPTEPQQPPAQPPTEQPPASTAPSIIETIITGFQILTNTTSADSTASTTTTTSTETTQPTTTTSNTASSNEPQQPIPTQQGGGGQGMQCPVGEYYGINDMGQKSCIKTGNSGGFGQNPQMNGGGFGVPQQNGGQMMQQQGPQMGGQGMPLEKMCDLTDEDIIDLFAGNMANNMTSTEQVKSQCQSMAAQSLKNMANMKLQIAQCKANVALDCEAKKQMIQSCKEVQQDPASIAKTMVDNMCRRFGVSTSQKETTGQLYDLAQKFYNADPALANQLGDTADKTKEDQKKLDIISYVLGNGNYGNTLNERAQKLEAVKERLQSSGNADIEAINALETQIKELKDEAGKFSNALDITRLGYLFRGNQ